MNELDLLTAIRPEAPLPAADDLAKARHRLMTALSAPAQPQRNRRQAGLTRTRPPWVIGAVVTGAVAAGIAITLVVTSAVPAGRAHLPEGHQRGPAWLTAAQFLTAAATAVKAGRGLAPQPGQYVYTENVNVGSTWYEEWLSADGSRPGLVISSGQPAGAGTVQPACTVAQAIATGCFLAAGYLPGLPQNAADVLAYLAKLNVASASAPAGQDTPNWLANDTGKAVAQLMSTTYLLPGQQSAVFQMLAQTPGFQLIPDAQDALGRSGVGIYWPYQGSGAMIVFDPVTYQFLGFGTWPVGAGPARSGRPVVAPDGSALAVMAIVNTEPAPPRSSAALRALVRQASAWARRQHPGQPRTVAEALTAYLRQVRHMSPAQIARTLAELGLPPGSAPASQPAGARRRA